MKLGDPTEIGVLMRRKRHELGFTLNQLAELTGISYATLLRLEQGRVGYIHEKTAKALEALELSLQTLKNEVKPRHMALVPTPDKTLEERLRALMASPAKIAAAQPVAMPRTEPVYGGDATQIGQVMAREQTKPKNLNNKRSVRPSHKQDGSALPTVKRALLWLAEKI